MPRSWSLKPHMQPCPDTAARTRTRARPGEARAVERALHSGLLGQIFADHPHRDLVPVRRDTEVDRPHPALAKALAQRNAPARASCHRRRRRGAKELARRQPSCGRRPLSIIVRGAVGWPAGTTTMITHLSARPLKLSIVARDELAREH
jgi:hypothetical protein